MDKTPMTFDDFQRYINIIIQDDRTREAVYKASNHSIELIETFSSLGAVVDLLSYIFHDEDDWIGYWCWELDMGKKWHSGMITGIDGKDIPLGTIRDLYELLIDHFRTYCQN